VNRVIPGSYYIPIVNLGIPGTILSQAVIDSMASNLLASANISTESAINSRLGRTPSFDKWQIAKVIYDNREKRSISSSSATKRSGYQRCTEKQVIILFGNSRE